MCCWRTISPSLCDFHCDDSALGSRSDLVCNELLKWLLADPEGDASFEAKQRRAASEDFNCGVDWSVLIIKSHFHPIAEWFILYGFIWISCLFKSVSSAWKSSSCFSRSRINIITTITQRKEQAIAHLEPDSRFRCKVAWEILLVHRRLISAEALLLSLHLFLGILPFINGYFWLKLDKLHLKLQKKTYLWHFLF